MALKKLSIILSLLLLTSCASQTKPIEITTTVENSEIPTQAPPAPVKMLDVTWYVVTEENFEEFKKKFVSTNGVLVFFAVSPKDYEALSLNFEEIARYIKQQKQIIVFYEKSIKGG